VSAQGSSLTDSYLWRRGEYVIDTDTARLDRDCIHGFLERAYWARGIPRAVVERSLDHSLNFGLYAPDDRQCGFARVVTDRAVIAVLCDVFVVPEHRGRGLGAWLVATSLAHPQLQGLRRWTLATADAHALYARFGFRPLADPSLHMSIEHSPDQLWKS
jgi:GNAT superfamily N-acetyltransferase